MNNFLETRKIVVAGHDVEVIRDDIFPFIGGGNKGRKALEYEKFLLKNKYNALVTTGGIQSNHNRAMALLAAKHGWKCHIVYHGSKKRFFKEKGNALLVRNTAAICQFVEEDEISNAMDNAISHFKSEGLNPFYITGGGHDLPGGIAYVKAIQDLYEMRQGVAPNYIFLASGTGSTQSGIIIGLNIVGWKNTKVIGISVARQYKRGYEVLSDFTKKLASYYNLKDDFSSQIYFTDNFLEGGYECFSKEMESFILDTSKISGLMFDTTYSGKALWGMSRLLPDIKDDQDIIFWHTGGLMNLMK